MSFTSSLTTNLCRGASRKPLTPKGGNKNFYKGTRSGSMGHFVNGSWNYTVDPKKVRQFIVPNLTDFKLKPYVSWAVPEEKGQSGLVTKDDFLRSVLVNK